MAELCQKGKRKEIKSRDSNREKEREGRNRGRRKMARQNKTKATKTTPPAVKILKNIGQCQGFDCDLQCRNSQITEGLLPPHGELNDLIYKRGFCSHTFINISWLLFFELFFFLKKPHTFSIENTHLSWHIIKSNWFNFWWLWYYIAHA